MVSSNLPPGRKAAPDVLEDGVVLFVGLHERKCPFAEHDGGVEFRAEMRFRRVAALEVHDHAGRGCLLPGATKLALRQIEAGYRVASPREFDGVPARAATNIQNSLRAIGLEFPFNEVDFSAVPCVKGSLSYDFP